MEMTIKIETSPTKQPRKRKRMDEYYQHQEQKSINNTECVNIKRLKNKTSYSEQYSVNKFDLLRLSSQIF